MIVLDSSALLASLQDEPGRDKVDDLIATQPCAIPMTCLSEVLARLGRDGIATEVARDAITPLGLIVLPFDDAVCDQTAKLEQQTRDTGTSFVDRSCIATGIVHDSMVFTADADWMQLDIADADIHLVR